MNVKKTLSLLLTVILSFSVFIGCGKDDNAEESLNNMNSENSNISYGEGEWKKYSPAIDVTFGYPHDINNEGFTSMANAGEPYDNNRWIKYYQEEVGVNSTYDLIAPNADDYKQKLILAMSSGDLPDIFWVNDMTLYKQLYDAGVIADLTSLYETQANPTLRSVLEGEGDGFLNNFKFEGELYTLPCKMPSTNGYNYLWVRKDWLDKLGLDIPKTMTEVANVAKAFAENDPDGNGKADTIGLTIDKSYLDMSAMGIFWAFGGTPATGDKYWCELDDGTLGFSLVQEEMKGGLAWLQDLYTQGLLNTEFSTKEFNDYSSLLADNKIGLFYGCHWYANYLDAVKDQMSEDAEWIPLLAPGTDGNPAPVYTNIDMNGLFCVSSEFAHPEAIIALFNAYTEKLFGKDNDFENYFATPENGNCWQSGPIYMLDKDVDLMPYRQMKEAQDAGNMDSLTGVGASYWKYISEGNLGYKLMFGPENSCFSLVDQTYPDIMVWNQYQGAPTATWTDRWSSLMEIIDSTYIKIITGELEVDSGFDQMVKEWNQTGGEQVTKEVNEIVSNN